VAERRILPALAGVLAATVLLAGCSGGSGPGVTIETPGNHGYHGTYLDDPYVIPPVILDNTAGKKVALSKTVTPVNVVFFGYSHCPDICQFVMSTIASALVRLDPAQRKDIQVTFVTTDPARDTSPVLREYLARFSSTFAGLTGPLPAISAMAAPLHVYLEKGTKLASGGYEVDHSTYVYGALGTDVKLIWDQGTSPKDLATDLVKLLKQKEPA
jgi:protein SCO1/2